MLSVYRGRREKRVLSLFRGLREEVMHTSLSMDLETPYDGTLVA